MQDGIRIVLADDHPIVRQGLRTTIEAEPSLKVVAEAGDGRAAVECIQAHGPDVAVIDIAMPGMDGLAVAEEIQRRGIAVKLIVLTIHRDQEVFERATELGVMGYVLKDSALGEIVAGIQSVAAGKCYASAAIAAQIMQRRRRAHELRQQAPSVRDLTPSERQILLLLAEYKTSSEIAEELHISPRTVDTHRTNICAKLDLRGKHALMKFAVCHRAELG